jgi:putative DNA methylase
MTHPIKSPRKLIEVALPLDAINEACAYEKMPGIGAHPRGIHLWWARRPLAAARAVLFAQLVNDPGYQQGSGFKYGVNKEEAAKERERLFDIIKELVKWENTNNEEVLDKARAEIRRSWREVCELNKDHPQAAELFNPDVLPAFHDPFAGGGAIPLEAQRLGLEAYASDLNPVAVLINKAMIEIPPKFASMPPVNPETQAGTNGQGEIFSRTWKGVEGLAEDVRYYGKWIRERAKERIGHLYPKVKITEETAVGRPDLMGLIGQELTVIAWLWVRTVKSPNPAYSHLDVPLASTFMLSNKEGKEAYVEPVVEEGSYRFVVKMGAPKDRKAAENGTKLARGANFKCIMSNTPIPDDHIYDEANAGRMGTRLMAIVAEGKRTRVYLSPSTEMEETASKVKPEWRPELPMPDNPRWFSPPLYGLKNYGDIFTPRQLVALTTLVDLVQEARAQVGSDALAVGLSESSKGLAGDLTDATAYADALCTYLAFAIDRCADFSNSVTRWVPGNQKVMNLFGKQAIPMTWDFPEAAILADTVGSFVTVSEYIADCIYKLSPSVKGYARQGDAQKQVLSNGKVVSTDPPYYDNIGYADLSDFFYVWMRRSLR